MLGWTTAIVVVFIFAKTFGKIAHRLGQPVVIGEMLAGIFLGPMVVGNIDRSMTLFSNEALASVTLLADLGLIFLMFEVSSHLRKDRIRTRHSSAVATIASVGISLSFLTGCGVAAYSKDILAPEQLYWPYILFVGMVFSVTALPVLIKVISCVGGISFEVRALAVASALIVDTLAWVLLSFVLAVSKADTAGWLHLSLNVGGLLLLIGLSVIVLRPFFASRVAIRCFGINARISLALCCCLIYASVTSFLGFHLAIGAVLAGYIFYSDRSFDEPWSQRVGAFNSYFLSPIFFGSAGLKMSSIADLSYEVWLLLAVFLLAGVGMKFVSSYSAARMSGLSAEKSIEIGFLMNTKGLVEIVIISIGLEVGILSVNAYSVMFLFSFASAALVGPAIKIHRVISRSSKLPLH